jgi:multidrug efflux pump subunit AcrB
MGFVPTEDQGYLYVNVQIPFAASMDRTLAVCHQLEDMVLATPGDESCLSHSGHVLRGCDASLSFTAFPAMPENVVGRGQRINGLQKPDLSA